MLNELIHRILNKGTGNRDRIGMPNHMISMVNLRPFVQIHYRHEIECSYEKNSSLKIS